MDNADGTHSNYGVQTLSRGPVPDFPLGVPLVTFSPSQTPQANVINAEFHQSIHMLAQLLSSQADHGAFFTPSSEVTRVGQFMKLNPLTFTGVKVEEDPQGFIDKMEKIFRVMHTINVEGVEFAAYQMKDVAY